MPDITNGREKINAFLKEKGIKKTTLAVAYGFKRQEVTNILSGTTKGPRANSFILQVIEDYGIEQERFEEQGMNNAGQKVTRIDKDAWDIATELANEYGVSICHIISESVRYCAENAEFKEMDVVVKRLVIGNKVVEQERIEEQRWKK